MNTKELIELADNAYYATEYDKAVELYLKALENAPKNKHAQTQLAKAERNRSLKTSPPPLPIQAIQLYRRSRSFIAAHDLLQAKKLLTEAISLAKNAGTDFLQAEELLNNLTNALKAEELKRDAFIAIDTQQWAKAMDYLNFAKDLDPTDETTQILTDHLQKLIKAQSIILQLKAGISNDRDKKRKIISEVQEIINDTNETTVLSKLWQEVVRSFAEYSNKEKSSISRELIGLVLVLVIASGIIGAVSAQYYWGPGAYVAMTILAISLLFSLFAFLRR